MIKLVIEPYCHDCEEFVPVADPAILDIGCPPVTKIVNTIVKCKHEDRCKAIYEYLDKMREKNKLYNEVMKERGELI